MKFVCERCQTKYSIADEKVRGKVLKVRCKTCTNVITVRETGAAIDDMASDVRHEVPVARSGSFDAGADDGDTVVAPRPGRLAAGGGRAAALAGLPAAALFSHGGPAASASPRRTAPAPVSGPEIDWYLAVDGAQTGPFSRGRLIDKLLAVARDADVHVWNAEFDGWKAPSDVAELRTELTRRRRATPMPPPPAPLRRPTGAGPAMSATGAPVSSIGGASASEADGLFPLEGQGQGHVGTASVVGGGRKTTTGKTATIGSKKNGAAAATAGLGGVGDLFGPAAVAVVPPTDSAAAAAALGDPLAMLTPAPAEGNAAGLPTVGAAPAAAATGAKAGATTGKRGQVKLLLGALAVVLVLCGIVSIWMFKRPPVVVAVGEPAPPKPAGTDFAGMAARLAQEDRNKAAAPANPAAVPAATPAPAAAPPPVETKPLVARLEPPQRGGRGRLRRKGSTTPPPLGATAPGAFTAEQRDAANRFGGGAGRDVRIPSSGGGGGARTTPAQADISRVINNNRQGIQTCYQRALLRDNTLTHGKVTVRVSIGLSGKVKSVSLDAPVQFRALEPCIRDVMSRWAFPPSSEEYGTEFPVVLQGG